MKAAGQFRSPLACLLQSAVLPALVGAAASIGLSQGVLNLEDIWWNFHEHGIVHIRGLFGPGSQGDGFGLIQAARHSIGQLWELRSANPGVAELRVDVSAGPPGAQIAPWNPSVLRYNLEDVPESMRWEHPYRMYVPLQLCEQEELFAPWCQLLLAPRLREVMTSLLGAEAFPNNFLVFERGSEQGMHFDTWYGLGADHYGGMAAAWVALEDVDGENGPLRYVPGSHKLPPYPFHPAAPLPKDRAELPNNAVQMAEFEAWIQDAMERRNLSQADLQPVKAGDVVIWHEQLYHGGAPIQNASLTRRSLVSHYRPRPSLR